MLLCISWQGKYEIADTFTISTLQGDYMLVLCKKCFSAVCKSLKNLLTAF